MDKGPETDLLVERAREGDTVAFGALVEKYSPGVRALCLLRVPDPDRADDISQQVFLTAWKRMPDLRPGSAWWPWLEAIARNHLRNEWRRVQRERGFRQRFTVAWLAERDTEEENTEEAHAWAARVENLKRCMAELPENLRKLVKLRYEDGLTSDHIAKETNRSADGVRQMLVRLRGKLRDCVMRRMKGL